MRGQVRKLFVCGLFLAIAMHTLIADLRSTTKKLAPQSGISTPMPMIPQNPLPSPQPSTPFWRFWMSYSKPAENNNSSQNIVYTPQDTQAYSAPVIEGLITALGGKILNMGWLDILCLLVIWFCSIGFNDAARNILVQKK